MTITLNKVFGGMAIIFSILLVGVFLFKHVPAVGWNYVFQHWYLYLLAGTFLIAVFFPFYGFAKVCESISATNQFKEKNIEIEATMLSMTEKNKRLEKDNQRLSSELEKAKAMSLNNCLGLLRLHQVLLVYIGTEPIDQLTGRIENAFDNREYGSVVANEALRHLFDLNHAPLDEKQREMFCAPFNNGMNRW